MTTERSQWPPGSCCRRLPPEPGLATPQEIIRRMDTNSRTARRDCQKREPVTQPSSDRAESGMSAWAGAPTSPRVCPERASSKMPVPRKAVILRRTSVRAKGDAEHPADFRQRKDHLVVTCLGTATAVSFHDPLSRVTKGPVMQLATSKGALKFQGYTVSTSTRLMQLATTRVRFSRLRRSATALAA